MNDWPQCDGAILAGVTASIVDFVHERCPHVIFCSGGTNPHDLPVVCLNDQAAGVMAAEHLIDCGLVSFGFHDLLAVDQPDIAAALRFIREHACDPCSVEDVLEKTIHFFTFSLRLCGSARAISLRKFA